VVWSRERCVGMVRGDVGWRGVVSRVVGCCRVMWGGVE
jgi:hypothetical protein